MSEDTQLDKDIESGEVLISDLVRDLKNALDGEPSVFWVVKDLEDEFKE